MISELNIFLQMNKIIRFYRFNQNRFFFTFKFNFRRFFVSDLLVLLQVSSHVIMTIVFA